MDNFAKAGGKIYVCSPCFKKRKLDEQQPGRRERPSSAARSSSSSCPTAVPASATNGLGKEPVVAYVDRHLLPADASFDGGDLDCGNGLLLLIRQHIDPLEPGQLLEFRSTETSVDEDLPAWCRLTGNELVSVTRHGRAAQLPRLQGAAQRARRARPAVGPERAAVVTPRSIVAVTDSRDACRPPAPAPADSARWPSWASAAGRGRAGCCRPCTSTSRAGSREEEFEATADDAVAARRRRAGARRRGRRHRRRAAPRQLRQLRRQPARQLPADSRSPTCCPTSTTPRTFEAELRVARRARQPRSGTRPCSARSGRSRPLALHELEFVRALTRQAGQGRAAGPLPPHAHDVAGVRLRPRLSRPARTWPRTSCASCARRSTACSPPVRRSSSSTSRC